MTSLQALMLGLVQGLTEFLPVSSSGHLVLLQKRFGFSHPPIAFDVLLHVATLLAIVWVFKRQILELNKKSFILVLVGLIPTGVIGLALNSVGEDLFNSQRLVGIALIVTTIFLTSTYWIKEKKDNSDTDLSAKAAILIGIAQGIAVIPGISRSGTTIITGLWVGLSRKSAVTYSFLLSIPAIVGAQLLQLSKPINLQGIQPEAYILGFLSAAITGFIALQVLLKVIKASKLHWFAIYTLILAFFTLLS